MKFDFNHIDPRTGMPRMVQNRPENDINLMSRRPSKSGWIKMLQNRVNLRSVGNLQQARVVWYDHHSGNIQDAPDSPETGVSFRLYRLPSGQYPQGWIYESHR